MSKVSLITKVKQLVSGARSVLQLPSNPKSTPEGQQTVRRYSTVLQEAARLSAGVREAGHDLFTASRSSAERIRARQARVGELSDAKAEVDAFSQQLGQCLAAEKEALAADIHETVQVVSSLHANPLPGPALARLKEQIEPYGTALLRLIAQDNAARSARRLGTMALRSKLDKRDKDVADLQLKARFLAGETLRPEDLGAQPPAPRAGRRRTPR